MQGTVEFFNPSKGWGFIKRNDEGKDIFVHYSEIQMDGYKSLNRGDVVSFDVGDKDGKTIAANVVLLEAANGN